LGICLPVTQLKPMTLRVLVSISARSAGGVELAGKYAKKLGCCLIIKNVLTDLNIRTELITSELYQA